MSSDLSRVRYTPRQFLGARDFSDEQAYHLGMRRRHNIAHHTWGIVRGLELKVEDGETLFVQPGFAVDGFGRELMLPERAGISVDAFDERGRDTLGIFLSYNRLGNDAASSEVCADDDDANNPNRWREVAQVEIAPIDPDIDYRTDPPVSDPDDLKFAPYLSPPDDPARRWLVFLGQFVRRRGQDRRYTYLAVLDNRPYAGLIGEAIYTPWENGVRVEFGSPKEREQRFAVRFPGNDPENPPAPVFEVKKDGKTLISGQTTINGEVLLEAGGLRFDQVAGKAPETDHWGIYRARPPLIDPKNPPAGETLYVTMGDSDLNNRAVIIGAWSAEGEFRECLTINDDGTVEVNGNLDVRGNLLNAANTQQPAPISQTLSERNQQFRQLAFQAGLSGSPGVSQFVAVRTVLNLLTLQRENIITAANRDEDLKKQLREAFESILERLDD